MKALTFLCVVFFLAGVPLPASESGLLLGTVVISGAGTVNDRIASPYGMSLGSGDSLKTSAKSGAVITVSGGDTLVMGEDSGITLVTGAKGIAAELQRGRVTVITSHKQLHEVRLPGESLVVRSSPGSPSRYQITRLADATYILPSKGIVFIYRNGSSDSIVVPQGMMGVIGSEGVVREYIQRASTAPPQVAAPAASPSMAPGKRAGQLSAVIPADFVVRGPDQKVGAAGEEVLLNDLLKTGQRGRMRFSMDDGSILTVGSNSQIQVVDHNAQSQQTSMEMLYGKMRAQVTKRTAPGGKFEIRTSTAICGVLGTDFYIEATRTSTRVVVFQGLVRLTPLIAGAIAGIAIGAGQTGAMAASSASAPIAATASQIQTAVTLTTVSQEAAQAAAAGLATAASSASQIAIVTAAVAPPAVAAAIAVPLLDRKSVV
jgi:hypothetical protein